MRINLLALKGGRPYVEERLCRFPGESNIDWAGKRAIQNQKRFDDLQYTMAGRQERAYLVNHAARVAEKIRQYVFNAAPERDNLADELRLDITRTGKTLDAFMGDALEMIAAAGWCWIGIDAPALDKPISQADAERRKIRPYWNLYSPMDVVDWSFDAAGVLQWLITEGLVWKSDDPTVEPEELTVRRLWRPGVVDEYVIDRSEVATDEAPVVVSHTRKDLGVDFVPFALAGEVSPDPHWFDDVEDVQRAILDLESSLDTLFHRCVFAQMVLPDNIIETPTSETGGRQMAETVSAIVGLSNAIIESAENRGVTRYLAPDSSAIKAIQEELGRKRQILFDTVGLHLSFTRRFSESAEATEFDHLDPQAVLRNYSRQIAEAETKAWTLTNRWDPTVPVIVPRYADKFRVTNLYEDFKSLVLGLNLDMPDSSKRLMMRGVVDSVLEITKMRLPPADYKKILADIEKYDFSVPVDLAPGGLPDKTIRGVVEHATDDEDGTRREMVDED